MDANQSSSSAPNVLSADELAAYQRDGYLFPRRVMTANEAAACRASLDAYYEKYGDAARGNGLMTKKPHLLLRWIADLIRNPMIVDQVEDIIGPDILCWSTALWAKQPGTKHFVSWHQDANYWGLSSTQIVSAWVAITPSTIENGCMRFQPGSHKKPLPHDDKTHEENLLSRGQTISDGIDETKAVDIELQPGEFALFDVNMAHSSKPNTSNDDRIGISIRYIAGDVYQTKANHDCATLIRGRDLAGFFEHEPIPECDFDPIALDFHTKNVGKRKQIYYR